MEHPFFWLDQIPGVVESGMGHVAHSILVFGLLVLFGFAARRALAKDPNPELPTARFGIRAICENVLEFIVATNRQVIGKKGDEFVWLLAGLFFYVVFSNLLGLVPGFAPPTSNIQTNYAIAGVIFVAYNYYGVREHGVAYLKQFTGPVIFIAPLMIFIELIGHVFRPVTLSVRLFGNMTADHLVLEIFTGLTPYVVPVAFLALGMVVCIVQAFVFYILSTVYINMAISHDH